MTTTDPSRKRVDHRRTDLVGAPLDEHSLIWKHGGDWRAVLLAGRAGVLQNMHPAVSQALLDHSNYFTDPIARISRSIPPILGVIFDDDPHATGAVVRDFHKDIRAPKGSEHSYRALDPDVFWWTHATFIESIIATEHFFGTPFTRVELEQVYAEGITWWRRYGMSMAPVQEHYQAFTRYWDRCFEDGTLQATPVALDAVNATEFPIAPPLMPEAVWKIVGERVAVAGASWLTHATLPEQAREMLGIEWRGRDERAGRAFCQAVRLSWNAVPVRTRKMPRAAAALRRAEERRAAAAAATQSEALAA